MLGTEYVRAQRSRDSLGQGSLPGTTPGTSPDGGNGAWRQGGCPPPTVRRCTVPPSSGSTKSGVAKRCERRPTPRPYEVRCAPPKCSVQLARPDPSSCSSLSTYSYVVVPRPISADMRHAPATRYTTRAPVVA